MSVFENIKNFLPRTEEDDDEYEAVDNGEEFIEEQPQQVDVSAERRSKVRVSSSRPEIVLVKPTSFKEYTNIGDDVNMQKTVIINLENVTSQDAARIMDFLHGVAHANNARVEYVSAKTFVIMPENVVFSGIKDDDDLDD